MRGSLRCCETALDQSTILPTVIVNSRLFIQPASGYQTHPHAWCINAASAKVAITRLRIQKISRFAWNEDVTPLVETSRSDFANRRARISATRKGKTAHPNANISRNGNVASPW